MGCRQFQLEHRWVRGTLVLRHDLFLGLGLGLGVAISLLVIVVEDGLTRGTPLERHRDGISGSAGPLSVGHVTRQRLAVYEEDAFEELGLLDVTLREVTLLRVDFGGTSLDALEGIAGDTTLERVTPMHEATIDVGLVVLIDLQLEGFIRFAGLLLEEVVHHQC